MLRILNMSLFAGVFLVLTVGINVLITTKLLKQHDAYTPRIVTVNSADLLLGLVVQSDPSISQDALNAKARRMNASLEKIVLELAQDRNLIVVNSASVLAGAEDISGLVLSHPAFAGEK
ncbi:MAG: hypothetical protein ABJO67_02490 [Pseudoruegeria sp.]